MPEPTPPSASRHVFVYGTLRRGDVRDITRLRPAPQFVGLASVAGVLYDLGPYPGVVLGGPARVTGEVYTISAELERQLDVIEEVWPQQTGEYRKQAVRVRLDQPQALSGAVELDCLVYEINPARAVGQSVITGGDWLDHLRQRP
ncbi:MULTISPECIES: gamma-glutamylcyclotransferase family protein [unclassified Polaromonas]|jgi:gamma-glutamylcyclotransferase (GGCT)/AIG2-like uncharacterized protein YtfP|uniref:gamma-glutamylcyclotransferase family protein n=1 Tax=unclassified Polaromonas TaxID=2638319 RepID=UPI000BCA88B5|nr:MULTISPECIES: gamma-glutamylcyclotransferase family protein [unclassified Polaromonas]OYY35007.1 MAG: gamma-glutamylcyclotransferase [Polaromonas sp. 35-63-35]OYZ20147.1 MAG: gamma-glutamylcyclotransferase [Polaromonas sp. 16-63-31]OYZ77901.1 MAG: gamma-glutamylcyclotransferase [Polaromonas sp. 24-63-21]OZA49410.1 MAG: gamma-glutamylcyclotransferase [Polaromonas sp. 17-63-33]OZA87456.1 MAG: gamma-glutamylcyclotransferase [Polaromonas sp. 39-63-25]